MIKDLKSSLICLIISIVILVLRLVLYNAIYMETTSSLDLFGERFLFFNNYLRCRLELNFTIPRRVLNWKNEKKVLIHSSNIFRDIRFTIT